MSLMLEKCCCFIPLRLGTFFIAIWFFAAYLIYTATGFVGINGRVFASILPTSVFYSGQKSIAWYYIGLLFSIFVCVGGLLGVIGSCTRSRGFAKAFSVIVWINCLLSALIYVISLVLMATNSPYSIESCKVIGFVDSHNPHKDVTPVQLSTSDFYTPVKYPGLLTEHAASENDCAHMTKMFTITFGAVVFVVQLVQIYFAYIVNAYAKRLSNGARHHRLHAQQIKDFEESRYHMSTVY